MIKKLRRRFVFINMLIVTIMLFTILGMTVSMTKSNLEEDSLEALYASYAPDKRDHRTDGGKEEKFQKPNNTFSEKEEKPEKEKGNFKMPTFTLMYSDAGELVAQGSDFYDLTDTEYLQNIFALAKEKGTEQGVLWSQSLRFLRINGVTDGYSFVDISNEQSTLWNLLLDSMIVGAIAFGGFLILSIFLARLVIQPVEKAWMQQQQFVADASHELKTPLTVIITGAELLEDPNLQPETRRQCVANILETSKRMRSLTEEMLTLAKAENVQEEMLEERCDLSELLEDSVLSFEPLFFERGVELQWEIAPNIQVKGDESQLRRLGDILLDNAQKYSLPGVAKLTLKKHGGKVCELMLSNPATEMSEEDLERIFERFYRADPARTATGSFGMGLSIANGIVHRHRGTIKATQQDGWIRFTVRLPLCV